MPFEPLTPEEQKRFAPPCRDPQHDPPTHIYISEPSKWRCPSCGKTVLINPVRYTCRSS